MQCAQAANIERKEEGGSNESQAPPLSSSLGRLIFLSHSDLGQVMEWQEAMGAAEEAMPTGRQVGEQKGRQQARQAVRWRRVQAEKAGSAR